MASSAQAGIDELCERGLAEGILDQATVDAIAQRFAPHPAGAEREAKMRRFLDSMVFRDDLSHVVRDLKSRPELNGLRAVVTGASELSKDSKTLRYPTRVLLQGEGREERMLLRPWNLAPQRPGAGAPEPVEEGGGEGSESGEGGDEADGEEAIEEEDFGEDTEDLEEAEVLDVVKCVSEDDICSALKSRPKLSLQRVQRTIYRATRICERFYYGPGGPTGLDATVAKRIGYLQHVFNGSADKLSFWLLNMVQCGSPDDINPHTGEEMHLVQCNSIQQMALWVRTGCTPRDASPPPALLKRVLVPSHMGY